MQRIPEPELMDDLQQAIAYDQADFSESHSKRVTLFQERYSQPVTGNVLDLGCGSGDILERFAIALPQANFIAVDGSAPMLELARTRFRKSPDLSNRIQLVHSFLPSQGLQKLDYQIVMSNSMLHHLHQPQVLWKTIKQYAAPDSFIFVGDLRRPKDEARAAELINELAADEPDVLRRDFYNSLCAAFTADEIRKQLSVAGLPMLVVEEVGEIHVLVYGTSHTPRSD